MRIGTIARILAMCVLPAWFACGTGSGFKSLEFDASGMHIRVDLQKTNALKSQVLGVIRIKNNAHGTKSFVIQQLYLHNHADRFRTYVDKLTALMINYGPVHLAPNDSARLNAIWVAPLPFDTTGMFLEYTDFMSFGRLHTLDTAIVAPDPR
jgi:hypothetical protein